MIVRTVSWDQSELGSEALHKPAPTERLKPVKHKLTLLNGDALVNCLAAKEFTREAGIGSPYDFIIH